MQSLIPCDAKEVEMLLGDYIEYRVKCCNEVFEEHLKKEMAPRWWRGPISRNRAVWNLRTRSVFEQPWLSKGNGFSEANDLRMAIGAAKGDVVYLSVEMARLVSLWKNTIKKEERHPAKCPNIECGQTFAANKLGEPCPECNTKSRELKIEDVKP